MANIESTLALALDDLLTRDRRTTDSQIEVIDNNGVITLSGVALSQEARRVATEVASNHPGVLSVINDLDIDDPDATSDVEIVPPLPTNGSYWSQ